MKSALKIWCVVPAAGAGRRFGAAIPKQYLPLAERTVLEHTLHRLLAVEAIAGIALAISPEDDHFSQLEIAQHPLVEVVHGGAERCQSVLNGLIALQAKAQADDWVLVHDVARPCVRRQDIQLLIAQVVNSDHCGGLLATPVRDTMKRADSASQVTETVERQQLWHALTPQLFPLGLLTEALQQAIQAHALVTDEASALERLGYRPLLVQGHSDNIKITHSQDLVMAELFLQQQLQEQLQKQEDK